MRAANKIGILVGLGVVSAGALWALSRGPVPAQQPSPPPVAEAPKPAMPDAAPSPPPPKTVAPDAAPLAPPAPAPHKAAHGKPKPLTEAELLDRLRKAQDTDEYLYSYELAREGLRRFPNSPDAPEMAAMVVKSLARQGKVSEARAEAEVMVNKYAGTHWAREVERRTGAHPTVNQSPPK